ncbi:MAG: DoxX family protein [Chitinophagales bacterium]|nr:DoxX family protein [Chitinophagales bacterium]
MNAIQKMQAYGDTHHPKWLDILRIVLGLVLFAKGFTYVSNTAVLSELLQNSRFPMQNMILVHYIAFAHLIGGILVMIGLLTRIAVLFQIPILLGAVIFVHAPDGMLSAESNMLLALLVLGMLVFYFIYGSGPWSVDALLDRDKEKWDVTDL